MSNINPDFALLCGLYIFSGGAQFIVAMFLLTVVQPQQQAANLPPQSKKDVHALAYGFLVAGSVIFLLLALLLLYGKALSTFTLAILLLSVLLVMVPIQVVLGFLTLQRKTPEQAQSTEITAPVSLPIAETIPHAAVVPLPSEILPLSSPMGLEQTFANYLDAPLLAEMVEAGIADEMGTILNEAIRLWLRRRALAHNEPNQEFLFRSDNQPRYWQRYQSND
ncbi:MAG: hypothetical protein WCO45_11545 [Pseudanabaena sp. ELA607]|jgi:hypothetical protein